MFLEDVFLPYIEAEDLFQANSKATALRGNIDIYAHRLMSDSQLPQSDIGLNDTNNLRSTSR